jgi:hypothetical protein
MCVDDHRGRPVIAKDVVGSTPIEYRQHGAVAADLHHVLDQGLNGLLFALFPLEPFTQLVKSRIFSI